MRENKEYYYCNKNFCFFHSVNNFVQTVFKYKLLFQHSLKCFFWWLLVVFCMIQWNNITLISKVKLKKTWYLPISGSIHLPVMEIYIRAGWKQKYIEIYWNIYQSWIEASPYFSHAVSFHGNILAQSATAVASFNKMTPWWWCSCPGNNDFAVLFFVISGVFVLFIDKWVLSLFN